MNLLTFVVVQLIYLQCSQKIFANAQFKVDQLHQTETLLFNTLEKYIKSYEEQITNIKKNLDEYQEEHERALEDVEKYLSNPINSYLLTKRLTVDWNHVYEMMMNDTKNELRIDIQDELKKANFPTYEDLKILIGNLLQLQYKYQLTVEEIAGGYVDEITFSGPLSAMDCFEIGRYLHDKKNYSESNLWLEKSLELFETDVKKGIKSYAKKSNILDFLSVNNFYLDKYEIALKQATAAFKLSPSSTHMQDNIKIILDVIAKKKLRNNLKWKTKIDLENLLENSEHLEMFKQQCNGNNVDERRNNRQLRCMYFSDGSAEFKLKPFKLEIVNVSPYVIMIHDFLRDHEIEVIKKLTEPHFVEGQVESNIVDLSSADNTILQKLDKKIGFISSADMNASEDLRVIKYLAGGQTLPHFGYLQSDQYGKFKRNRMNTILFHLSDVHEGGETIFPFLNVIIKPIKGSMVTWPIVHENGDKDLRVLHGSCQVSSAEKWVAYKWIREDNQEFRSPCKVQSHNEY